MFVAVLMSAFVSSLLAGQQPAQRPVFRTATNVVPIDVRVVDREGKPVTDLKQEEFTILEDGVPQVIRHFSSVRFSANAAAASGDPAFRGEQPDALEAENRRVFLIVMGRGRHQQVSKYVDAIADFVGSKILPQDHVALMAWNRATDFTTDKALLKRVLLKYRDEHNRIEAELNAWFSGLRALYGSKEIPPHIQKMIDDVFAETAALRPRPLAPAAVRDASRTDKDVMRTAMDLQRNADLVDRRAAGFNTLPDPVAERTAAMNGLTFEEYVERMSETLQDTGNLYAAIGYLRFLAGEKHLVFVTSQGVSLPSQDGNASLARVAADARIALDLIQTGGTVGAPRVQIAAGQVFMQATASTDAVIGQHLAIKDLQLMADRTGGQLMAFKTGEAAVQRLADAIQFQYLLAYTPLNANWDAKFRRISVRVSRPGARVLAREGYVATQAPLVLDRRAMIVFSRISSAAAHANTIDHVKVKLGRVNATAKEVSVDVTVDISRLHFELKNGLREAVLDVALLVGGEGDQPAGEVTKHVDLRYGDDGYERALKQGATFQLTAPLRMSVRNIKVVVYDFGADRVGSAVTEVYR